MASGNFLFSPNLFTSLSLNGFDLIVTLPISISSCRREGTLRDWKEKSL